MDSAISPDKIEFGLEIPQPVSSEHLQNWIEAGLDTRAVAVYGTSIEVLSKLIKTGEVPFYPIRDEDFEYRKIARERGGQHLYYFHPLMEKVQSSYPDVYEKLRAHSKEKFGRDIDSTDNFFRERLDEGSMLRSSRGYAFRQSLEHSFERETGKRISDEEIMALIAEIDSDNFKNHLTDSDEDGIYRRFISEAEFYFSDYKKVTTSIRKSMTKDRLLKIVQKCGKRRGVLLFFNDEIFQQHFGVGEGEDELIVASQAPLKSAVISGIRFLSKADEIALMESLK